ncbi:MAG: hypothetical protein R3C03_22725 [Pirellulaceae bacterium]
MRFVHFLVVFFAIALGFWVSRDNSPAHKNPQTPQATQIANLTVSTETPQTRSDENPWRELDEGELLQLLMAEAASMQELKVQIDAGQADPIFSQLPGVCFSELPVDPTPHSQGPLHDESVSQASFQYPSATYPQDPAPGYPPGTPSGQPFSATLPGNAPPLDQHQSLPNYPPAAAATIFGKCSSDAASTRPALGAILSDRVSLRPRMRRMSSTDL